MRAGVLVAVVIVALSVVAVGAYILFNNGGSDEGPVLPDEPPTGELVYPREVVPVDPSQWTVVGGDVGSFGVTDSKAPVSDEDFELLWKVSYAIDGSATAWRTPSSAICVGDKAYYYVGSENSLLCVELSTGEVIAKAPCPSRTVYNMALASGDGKVFAVTSTGTASVVYAYDSETLGQLFVSVPIDGGETQGTVTYHDGKVFFGTYSGDYACFSSEDVDPSRSDEAVEPLWLLEADGWYNATPAFFGDLVVLVQRGFESGGATAYLIDSNTGVVLDDVHFDREYSSSGATAYEGRVYIPLNRLVDRNDMNPNENSPEKLAIRSYVVSGNGFDLGSEKYWESEDGYWKDHGQNVWGGTQSMPTIWNDTIYIGGGGKTLGSDEPLWIIDIAKDGTMKARQCFSDICTKATPMVTTAYSSADNGFAVYIYVMEYGHVNPGEAVDSTNGYADVFVIRDSKNGGAEVVSKFRPEPQQFCYQSFTISEDGYLLIRNDTTLFCYGGTGGYTSEDVSGAIDRFLAMAEDGNVNMRDYERIMFRYSSLDASERSKVANYQKLQAACCTLTVKAASGDIALTVPKGAIVEVPDVAVPEGKLLSGWTSGGAEWVPFSTPVTKDTVIVPRYSDTVTVTFDPGNGEPVWELAMAEGGTMPFVYGPSREGYVFGGWFDGRTEYGPLSSKVTKDTGLSARWLKVSQLGFDTDGGSVVSEPYQAVYGRPIGSLPTTVKAGHTFMGWYHDGTRYTPDTVYPFEEGIVLKAVWSENSDSEVDNGKGLSIAGKFPDSTSLTVSRANPNGSTAKKINQACVDATGGSAESILVTLRGDGINGSLPLSVRVKVTGAEDGSTVPVFYYPSSGTVVKVDGSVVDGVLGFSAYGYELSNGIQLAFGVPAGLGVYGCV